ncbi:DUF4153 domain-containing protein [Actinoplanes palleronii]|uniref:DUF4173 domain-containing protein n=1 Tax=Actinoplanes palleronii TaxID=113570 RepID=A0ABQ4BSP4_9ACTN|nr:DUF4173 domain-containing protein [Actinoplanes palleronii]GIE73210.1 hypothetical protein Apa02nite_093180 [Actinoplanes palleronii]
MAEPPPEQRIPTDAARPAATEAPQLLVMPPTDAIPSMVWPGADGETAWAIPVQIPAGTRGYALFVPMVALQPAAAAEPAAAAPPAAVPRVTESVPAPSVVPAPAAPEAPVVAEAPAPPEAPAAPEAPAEAPAAAAAAAAPAAAAEDEVDEARPAVFAPVPARVSSAPGTRPNPAREPVHPYRRYEPEPTAWQTFREKHWPGPVAVKGWTVPAGVLAGALGVAAFVPLGRTGIGWFLGFLVLAAGVVAAVRRSADLPHSERWIRSGWAAAALALLLVPAFRNAWWLVTFSVLGALGCAALAIVGGRLVRSILFSLVAAPYAAFRGLPWVRKHVRASRNTGIARRIGFSAGLTLVVLFVFGALLSSADAVFSEWLDDAVPDFNVGSVFQWIFLAVVGGLVAVSGIYTLSAPPATSSLDTPGRGRFGLVEWAPMASALVLLFAGFVVVQFTSLFGGSGHVPKTSGLSYAEYARSGFWQLVAVTLLSLALLAALARWAKRDEPIERILLRVLLGLLCALSVVIVVSALSRMWEYQRVYSFTGERIFVMSSEILLGVIFVMIAVAGIRWQGRWIPQTTVALAVLMLLGLAVLDPEGYAASRNAVRYEATGKIDAWYLRALSADATPALTRLPDPVRRCTLSWIADDLKEPDPWYAWNLGRARAREALDKLGKSAIGNHADCRAADQFDLPKKRR